VRTFESSEVDSESFASTDDEVLYQPTAAPSLLHSAALSASLSASQYPAMESVPGYLICPVIFVYPQMQMAPQQMQAQPMQMPRQQMPQQQMPQQQMPHQQMQPQMQRQMQPQMQPQIQPQMPQQQMAPQVPVVHDMADIRVQMEALRMMADIIRPR
jgi:hypothetical protein